MINKKSFIIILIIILSNCNCNTENTEYTDATYLHIKIPSPPQITDAITYDSKVIVFWSPPASNGGSQIIEYIIYRKMYNGSYNIVNKLKPNNFCYIDSNLIIKAEYHYSIRARNILGKSYYSNEVFIIPSLDSIQIM